MPLGTNGDTPIHPNLRCPVRLALFTDTVSDVNGVSRFIRNIATAAESRGDAMAVFSSTRLPTPAGRVFRNVAPLFACRMPGYGQLDLTLPPPRQLLRDARAWDPSVIHVSTPGPVGIVGRWIARRLSVPLIGTFHTDFAAYVERLFEDEVLGAMSREFLRWFYSPFDAVLTRSAEYQRTLASTGIPTGRIRTLRAGTDIDAFHPSHRNRDVWQRMGVVRPGVVVLSCGRVSVEKNLPLLARAWRAADSTLRRDGILATFVVVGDGPYLPQLRADLEGTRSAFLGFRHGAELASLYASSDLLAFPSTTDTLGQVVMEAQASGIPALVSDIGGPQSLIRNGDTGIVVRAQGGDTARVNAWAGAIASLVRGDAERRRMGIRAHEHMQLFGFRESFEQFWELHRNVARTLVDGIATT